MNTDKLVPIDFSRKITPPVIGDEFYNSKLKTTFIIDGEDGQIETLKYVHKSFDTSHFYVISYADRPNTGKQPVADDVEVDRNWNDDNSMEAKDVNWTLGSSLLREKGISGETWKPNHEAMVERYQASLADKEDERMNNIALNESDGSHYKVVSAIEALERFGYKYENGVWSQPEVKPELAAYMVPHVMDSSIKRLGVFLRKNELVIEGEGVIDCVIRELAEKHGIDIRTDEEKLRDAIVDIWEQEPDKDAIIDALLASFTIKGK